MIALGVLLGTPELLRQDSYGRLARSLLETTIWANRVYLEAHPETPALYRAGVSYGGSREEGFRFRDIPAVLDAGEGICSSLSAWRIAELRHAGERGAGLRIVWSPGPDSQFHVLVRRANGTLEDPSEILGMTPWPYSL